MINYMSDLKQKYIILYYVILYFKVITEAQEELIHIYYFAVNSRNVITATGKLALHGAISDQLKQVRKETFVCSHLSVTICINSFGLFQLCLQSLNFLFS